MKPRKYPYSGKLKIVKKLPKFVQLGYTAFPAGQIKYINLLQQVGANETLIYFKIPKPFLTYEERQVKVKLPVGRVTQILNTL